MVAPKSMSTLSLIPEESRKMLQKPSKSTESLYSSSSSKYSSSGLFRRRAASRTPALIPATNEVRQRVLSARRLRMKTLQNQLADAHQHIADLSNENRILRTLHKRQDSALAKYESTSAELPQLLHSHAEEIRIWQSKYRNLQSQNRELAHKLKQKDALILSLTDQNKHLTQLNKDKHLEERERLTERVRYLETRLVEKDNDIKLLARRLQLESKSFKNQLQSEHHRYREALNKLERARAELTAYTQLNVNPLEAGDTPNKPSLLQRNISGNKSKAREQAREQAREAKASQNLVLPQTESFRLPIPEAKLSKNDRDRSISPGTDDNPTDSMCSFSPRKPVLIPDPRRKPPQKEDISEAIQKGMAALEGNDSPSEDDDRKDEKQIDLMKDSLANPFDNCDFDEPSYDDDDDDDDDDNADVIISSEPKTKNDLDGIRRQMSEDYKNRESFLDTFCRQSSLDAVKENPATVCKKPEPAKRQNIDPKQKVKLLAALKAIDENEDRT